MSPQAVPERPGSGVLAVLIRRLTSGPEDTYVGPDRPSPSLALAALLAAGLALRLPWLGAIPNPWGAEGDLPLRVIAGAHGPTSHGPGIAAARALTTVAFAMFGPSFMSARLVMVLALLALTASATLLLRRRPALIFVAVLLLHPWSVAWSRTGDHHSAISLGLAALGPVAWWYAVRRRSPPALVLAAQCVALGLHFSPLAAIPAVACVLWVLLPSRRPLFQWPSTWVAVGLGVLHGALAVRLLPASTHASRAGVGGGLHRVMDSLSGVSTLAHFAGVRSWVEALASCVLLLLVALSARRVLHDEMGRFAGLQLAVATVALPLLAAPGADRWGFVLVAPWAMWCAAWAKTRPERALVGSAALALAVTAALASHFLQGSTGAVALREDAPGGRFLGPQVPRERMAVPSLVRDAILADAGCTRPVVVWSDPVFEPLRFVFAASRDGCVLGGSMEETIPEGRRVYRVTNGRWALVGWRRVRHWTMVGGAPLAALWARDTAASSPLSAPPVGPQTDGEDLPGELAPPSR